MEISNDAERPGAVTTGTARPPAHDNGAQATTDGRFERESRFWDELYRDEDVYGEIHRLRLATALRWIDELGLPPGTRVLELGCGAGLAAVALARRGLAVRATDTVGAMLERASANAAAAGVGDRVTFALADVQALELADESVDLVLALGVLPWIAAPGRALAEMARVTRSGGSVVVNADNAARLNYALDPRLNPHLASTRIAVKRLLRRPRERPGGQSRLHSIHEFDALLDAAGLDRERGQLLGFGPFTVLGRQALPDRVGIRLHRSLQERADRGAEALAVRGAQYLVRARKRPGRPGGDAA